MPNIILPPAWESRKIQITPESRYLDRRAFVSALGLGSISASLAMTHCKSGSVVDTSANVLPYAHAKDVLSNEWQTKHAALYPATRNARYQVAERAITPIEKATRYNNFYEFSTDKEEVWKLVENFRTFPWTIEIAGLVNKPGRYDLDRLVREMGLEERVYRFRCVEAWAMTVPWTGFPLAKLLGKLEPKSNAKFIKFVTVLDRVGMPGLQPWYPWPYHEALRLDEAMNELAFVATGLYGKTLPKQNGAPVRLVVPWKYGYKNIKSIVRIEFVETQPKTFWNSLAPDEYSFLSNIDPDVPHPRWSQATERLIDTGERVPTRKYNGYGEFVAKLYG